MEFLANKDILQPLRADMEKAANKIKYAIEQHRRVVVRHHNDTDGFCSGLMLEKAIIPLVKKHNSRPNAPFEKFKRMPLHTPFYGAEDSTKDIAQFLSIANRFNEDMPLIVLTDLGSGPENVFSVKQLQAVGCDVIIIDHHPIEPQIDELVENHINLHKYNAPNELAAGILCAEVARMLNPSVKQSAVISAVAAIGDRVEEEYARPYLNLAQEQGFSQEQITNMARCMDFTVYMLRNLDASEILNLLLSKRGERFALTQIAELDKRKQEALDSALPKTEVQDCGNHVLIHIPISKVSLRDYPRMGLVADIVKEHLIETKQITKPVVLLATTEQLVLCRATDESNFDFQEVFAQVKETFTVDGGGHPHAGTMRASADDVQAVFEQVKRYVASLQ